jgi:hypothetical protein
VTLPRDIADPCGAMTPEKSTLRPMPSLVILCVARLGSWEEIE